MTDRSFKWGVAVGGLVVAVIALVAVVIALLSHGEGSSSDVQASNAAAHPPPCVTQIPGDDKNVLLQGSGRRLDCSEAKEVVATWHANLSQSIGNDGFLEVGSWQCHALPLTEAPKVGGCSNEDASFTFIETRKPISGPAESGAILAARAPQPKIEAKSLDVALPIWKTYTPRVKAELATLYRHANEPDCAKSTSDDLVYTLDTQWNPRFDAFEKTVGEAMEHRCVIDGLAGARFTNCGPLDWDGPGPSPGTPGVQAANTDCVTAVSAVRAGTGRPAGFADCGGLPPGDPELGTNDVFWTVYCRGRKRIAVAAE